MTADALIERYVADVVLLLPRRQRHDVALELRALLAEEIAAAGDGNARELLTAFGHPAEVAARYGTPVALIDPIDTRRFLTLALAGAAFIHVAAFLGELIKPERDLRRAPDEAWPIVLGWLGLLFVAFAVTAWVRRRRPAPPAWKPRPLPTDRINRTARAAAIAFFAAGTFTLAMPATVIRLVTGGRAPQAALDAFAYDQTFLHVRGPVVLALMLAGLVIQAALVLLGRWQPAVRSTEMAHSLVVCIVLTWAIGTGPIFTATPTDQTVKGVCALIVLATLVDLAVRPRRLHVDHALDRHR